MSTDSMIWHHQLARILHKAVKNAAETGFDGILEAHASGVTTTVTAFDKCGVKITAEFGIHNWNEIEREVCGDLLK